MPGQASIFQKHFRGRNDDGTQTTATWKAAEDANWSFGTDTNLRVRFTIGNEGTGNKTFTNLQLEYNKNGAGWNAVTSASSVVRSATSANVTDATATTQQLTSGLGNFVAGEICTDGVGASKTLQSPTPNEFTEYEYVVQIRSGDVSAGDTIQLRVTGNGSAFNGGYSQTPTITVEAGAVTGDLSATLENTTLSGDGSAPITGDSATTQDGETLSGDGSAPVTGDLSTTQDGETLSAGSVLGYNTPSSYRALTGIGA